MSHSRHRVRILTAVVVGLRSRVPFTHKIAKPYVAESPRQQSGKKNHRSRDSWRHFPDSTLRYKANANLRLGFQHGQASNTVRRKTQHYHTPYGIVKGDNKS